MHSFSFARLPHCLKQLLHRLCKSVTFLIFHVNRDFPDIHPVPGTMLGAVETKRNPAELLPWPVWVSPLAP